MLSFQKIYSRKQRNNYFRFLKKILELNKLQIYKGNSQESDNYFLQDLYQHQRKQFEETEEMFLVIREDALLYKMHQHVFCPSFAGNSVLFMLRVYNHVHNQH